MKIKNFKLQIFQLLSSKILFFLATTALIVGLNLTPLITHIRHAPAGRTFGLIHNNVQDYYFYLALMNEGANGAWLTYDPYTSEPHQPSIIFSYFLWLGKLSKFLGLSYALTYHLVRIFLSILFLFFIFYFLYFISLPYPRLTYLLFLFAAPFMHTINDNGILRSAPFMYWWNSIDPIRRAAFLPHHMLGGILLILSILLIFKYINCKLQTNTADRQYLSKMILLAAAMAFVHTPSLLIMLLILPPSLFLCLLLKNPLSKFSILNSQFSINFYSLNFQIKNLKFNENFKFQISNYIGLLVYWFIGLLMLIFMISQTRNGFPWSQYIDWEKNLQFPIEKELIGALGILLPFAIIGIFHALKSRKFEKIFIACWLVVPFLFIPIAPKLNLSNIRLIQGVPYLPLAILAVFGIKTLTESVIPSVARNLSTSLRTNLTFVRDPSTHLRSVGMTKLFVYFSIGLFTYFTLPTLQWSLADQIREYTPIYGNVYLDNRLFAAFDFINLNIPPKTITLCTFYCGNYLPVYTNTISFIGHFGYTYNEEEKERNVQKFIEGKMSVEEAKTFLMSNKIALIFQGPEEKPLYKDYLYPIILKPVYDKEAATLYTPNF